MGQIKQFVIRDYNNIDEIINLCSLHNIVVCMVKLKDGTREYIIDQSYKDIVPKSLIENKQIEFVENLEVQDSEENE